MRDDDTTTVSVMAVERIMATIFFSISGYSGDPSFTSIIISALCFTWVTTSERRGIYSFLKDGPNQDPASSFP